MIFTNSTTARPDPTTQLRAGQIVYLDPNDRQWKVGQTTDVLERWRRG